LHCIARLLRTVLVLSFIGFLLELVTSIDDDERVFLNSFITFYPEICTESGKINVVVVVTRRRRRRRRRCCCCLSGGTYKYKAQVHWKLHTVCKGYKDYTVIGVDLPEMVRY